MHREGVRNARWLAKGAIANISYFKSLDWQGKERYQEKLEPVGLTLKDDPYSPENDGFHSDTTSPGSKSLRKPLLDRNDIAPHGVMPMRNLTVLCF